MSAVVLGEFVQSRLYHAMVPAGPVPTAQDPDGVYPYESFSETSRRPVLRRFRFVTMENPHLRVTICPDLGGKVVSLYLKKTGRETLFDPGVIRPVRILPRMAFVGGGIEVSFPISHTPVLLEKLTCRTEQRPDRCFVWCGEREIRFGMQWTVEFSLGADDTFLTQRTVFRNPTKRAHPWMSWSNAGVPARADTQFHFPNGPVLQHGDTMSTIDWPSQGPRRQSDTDRMIGFFWREPDCCAFGAFTPSLGCGLYHVADPRLTPGIKLWTDGTGKHEPWVTQFTLDGSQMVEIQAGPLVDQSIKDHLQPGQERHHIEFWIPSDQPLHVQSIPLPQVQLPDLHEVPAFDWARPNEVALWQQLIQSHASNDVALLPAPPESDDNRWAPSGMHDLGDALMWAAKADASGRDAWLFQLGAWHAGRDDVDHAIETLLQADDDRARVLCARLYRRNKNDSANAARCVRAIRDQAFALHPQVVVERDLALAAVGAQTLDERRQWLAKVSASLDESVIERRAFLLVDCGEYEQARHLLASTPFQLLHQRYSRTRLWNTIASRLNLTGQTPANWLGEDDLAQFGAYREYQED